MIEHKLKIRENYWEAIERGEKNFTVQRDDKGYQKGDILVLQKYDGMYYVYDKLETYKILEIRKRISYILTGGQLGIEPGYVVMSLKNV